MTFSFGNTPVYVSDGQTIRLKFKAPSAWNQTQSVTVKIGDSQTIWYISTVPEDFAPDPFPFTNLEDVTADVVYVYGDGSRTGEQVVTISGLTPGSEASVTLSSNWPGADVSNYSARIHRVSQGEADFGSWIIPNGTQSVSNTDRIQIRLRSNLAQGLTRKAFLQVGTREETWTLTTRVLPPNIPEPFPDFDEITGAPLNTLIYSNILRVTGLINPALVITSDGALIGISTSNASSTNDRGVQVLDNTTFVASSTSPVINNGEYLQLALLTPNTATTTVTNFLTIGDGTNGSQWGVTTGNFPSTTPDPFSFNNVTDQVEDALIGSDIQPPSGITGLGSGITVPVVLKSSSGTEPKLRIHYDDGTVSSIGVFPTNVGNGDSIQIYNRSSATFGDSVDMVIKVGLREINPWSITTNNGPDRIPTFVQPPNLVNKPPNTNQVSAIISLSDFNRDLTITATNGAFISIDFDTPGPGPRTFTTNNTTIQLYLNTGPTLGASRTTTVKFGDANPFTWSVSVYQTPPPPPELKGTWYSRKNAFIEFNTQSLRESKEDGLSIGTVLPILKQPDGSYGTIDGTLNSRFPGFMECDGRHLSKTEYVFLFDVIGIQYGECRADGTQSPNTTTDPHTHFKLPDFRNVKLTGTGVVDGNRPSSSFLPTNNINEPGNTGGYWYIDKVDVAGNTPFEQIFGPGGNTGFESQFFNFGTVKTIFNAPLTADVDFAVSGSVTAQIGVLSERNVSVPVHTHFFVSSRTDNFGGTGLIPWDTQVLGGSIWGTPSQENSALLGIGRGPFLDFVGASGGDRTDEYYRNNTEDWATRYISEMNAVTNLTSFQSFWDNALASNPESGTMVPDNGEQSIIANNFKDAIKDWGAAMPSSLSQNNPELMSITFKQKVWWPSHYSGLDKNLLQDIQGSDLPVYPEGVYGQTGENLQSAVVVTAAIDVEPSDMRVDTYSPPIMESDTDSGVESHSHMMTLQPITDPTTDFTYGNQSGSGDGKQGLGSNASAGAVLEFSLRNVVNYDGSNRDPSVYVSATLGQWSYRRAGDWWEDLTSWPEGINTEYTDDFDVTGGSGTGFKVNATFAPLIRQNTSDPLRYNRTKIRINSIISPGTGYNVGDILSIQWWDDQPDSGNQIFTVDQVSAAGTVTGAGNAINVTFNNNLNTGLIPPVDYVLNPGTFTLNQNIKKPIPNVVLQPNRQVPLIQEFHKVKYIIKAY